MGWPFLNEINWHCRIFQEKFFNDEIYYTLNTNDPTEEPVDVDNITEEACSNTYKFSKESIVNIEDTAIKPDEFNDEIEKLVDAKYITYESGVNTFKLDE